VPVPCCFKDYRCGYLVVKDNASRHVLLGLMNVLEQVCKMGENELSAARGSTQANVKNDVHCAIFIPGFGCVSSNEVNVRSHDVRGKH
jgi:hypothetical protein